MELSRVLGIFDSDLEYSSQLMNYIKRNHKSINQVRIFTNKAILYDYLLENHIDVLLISEDKLPEDIEHDNIERMCILSEGNYLLENHNNDKKTIYKFQSAEQIINELFLCFPNLKAKNNNSKKIKVISVFSLNDGFDKDNFSFNIANQYGITKKVLLVDLNILHGRYQLLNLDSKKNLSEFLYFLKFKTPNILLKMDLQVQRLENFDYLNGVMFGPDLYDLTIKDLEYWIEELEKSTYDTIIFNAGCFMEATLELIRKSNRAFLITKTSPWINNLYMNLVEQLKWTGYEDLIDKIEKVKIKRDYTDEICEEEINNIFTDHWGELTKFYARDV